MKKLGNYLLSNLTRIHYFRRKFLKLTFYITLAENLKKICLTIPLTTLQIIKL